MTIINYNRAANTLFIPDGDVAVDEAIKSLCMATNTYHRALATITLEDGTVVVLEGSGGLLADGWLETFLASPENLRSDIVVAITTGSKDDSQRVYAAISEIAEIATAPAVGPCPMCVEFHAVDPTHPVQVGVTSCYSSIPSGGAVEHLLCAECADAVADDPYTTHAVRRSDF